MKFTAIALLVLSAAISAAPAASTGSAAVHENARARELEPILYPGAELDTDDGSPIEMVPASSVALFPEDEVAQVQELANTATSSDNDDEALPQLQLAMDQQLPKELAPDTGEDIAAFPQEEAVLELAKVGAGVEKKDDDDDAVVVDPAPAGEEKDDDNDAVVVDPAPTDDATTDLAAASEDTPNRPLPLQLADKSDDITPTRPLPMQLADSTVDDDTTDLAAASEDTPNRPLPMQLADKSDDITPTRPLPMQLADNSVDDDTTDLAAASEDTPNRPLPMQLADKSDDITPTRPLPMQLADKSDDITPTRPLPMQLADNADDDDAANLATTRDLPLPVEMDQAPLLLEIVDDGEIAKLAPGDYGAVELPDDEEELLFSSSAQDLNDEMVEEVDADEVGTRYLLRGTGDSVTPRSLASDEEEWLIAHNTRRTKLYADNDLGPADLVWSTGLQAKAESYVQILLKLDACQAKNGLDDWTGGQNLGGARASRKGVVRTKEHALKTWYDDEKDLAFRKNSRYMAVGWRATKYVGCASGKKDFGTGECFIEVCRYIKKANCNVKADNWQAKMLADESPCGPSCPPEGCLAADSSSEVTTDAKATPAPTKAPTKSPTQAATTAPTKAAADSTAVAVVVPPEAAEWLTAHNTRRTALYAANNLGPVDLKWSPKTAEAAKKYLDILLALDGCSIKHYLDDWKGGENLAAAWSGSKGYGRKNTDAVKAWYEGEEKLGFGKNGHYTAVGWRATKYFGCANGKKDHGTGECFIEVCRYVKPGNCNVNADNWKAKMLADDSPCGPECPAEGCF